ncbi:MAG TPA: ATP-binding cassette domain-containing protein [Thermodesulfobacteriota bacterium]|nr:ATP-binding cassette domain-containing protein [Thermodesulfobacteriota bacterium]
MEIALEVENIFFRIDHRLIFQGLSFRLWRGEALLILGASGSGKSLLLKICAGLIIPQEGKVSIGGVDLASAPKEGLQNLRAEIGFVFQNSALISNMAVYDNVALPLRYHKKWSEEEVRSRVEEKLALFGVNRTFDRSIPASLSQEMHKRASLARAFILDPQLLLLDQPHSGLESENAQKLARIIRDYQRKTGASLLEVGSDWPPPGPPPDRTGLLEDGRIVAEGTMEEMKSSIDKLRNSRTAS